ncbi:MAG TPA: hypothetical protein VJ963_03235, partial [Bacteroidales bacterium]|nr:hypothetical protein [Bacteroidales bacterium]
MKITSKILTLSLFLLIISFFPAKGSPGSYASGSVLAKGKWYRIAVTKDGVYRIDYSRLRDLGLENPQYPRIYGNNTGQLSYYCSNDAPDDLREIAIYISKGSDGVFNDGDYILFYAQGTDRWVYKNGEYDFLHHNYSDTAYYFLTSGSSPGRVSETEPGPSGAADYISTESDVLFSHELDNENIIKSGREWYQPVSPVSNVNINPGFT